MVLGSSSNPSVATRTGMLVRRERISSIKLRKSGERCCTTTNAIPVSGRVRPKSCSSASRPPADAPTPTMKSEDRTAPVAGDICPSVG